MKKAIVFACTAVMALSLCACGKKSEKVISTAADLQGSKIGVQTGTTGDLAATDEYGDECVERFNTGLEAVQALNQGKCDAVIIDDQPAQIFVEKNEGLKILEEDFVVEDYAIALAKGNTELKDQINEAMQQLKEDGTFQSIVDYYIGKVEGSKPYEKKDVLRLNGTLIMATNVGFEPYEYYDNNEMVGLDIDFAQAIADILGMELKVEDMAFDSIIAAVTTGKADIGCAGLTVTEERLESVDFTDSYYTGHQVIIVKGK